MPSVTLYPPGPPFGYLGASPAVIAGSGPILHDGSDATYAELTVTPTNPTATGWIINTTLDALSGLIPSGATVTAIEVNARAQKLIGSPCRVNLIIHSPSDTTSSISYGVAPTVGGPGGFGASNEGWYLTSGIETLSHTLDDDDFLYWGSTFSGVVGLLMSGAAFAVSVLGNYPSTATISARVYEANVVVYYDAPTGIPPRRILGREGRSAARVYGGGANRGRRTLGSVL